MRISSRHRTAEVFILKSSIVGENNRRVVYLSSDSGVESATAYGGAGNKSRFCASLQPFVSCKLYLYDNNKTGFTDIRDVAVIESNDFIKENIDKIYAVSFCSEIVQKSHVSVADSRNFYHLLKYTIDYLSVCGDIRQPVMFFIAKLIFLSGESFVQDGCGKCGRRSEILYYDSGSAAFLCEFDTLERSLSFTADEFRVLEKFLFGRYGDIKNGDFGCYNADNLLRYLFKWVFRTYGDKLNSFSLLKTVLFDGKYH